MAAKKITASTRKKDVDFENEVKKKYGERVHIGQIESSKDILSTGSLSLDIATGVGGLPRGRIYEFSGMPSVGKSYRVLQVAKKCQEAGGKVALIDTEFIADEEYLELLGIDTSPDKWRVFFPENLETAADLTVDICNSGEYHMVIFDSIAGAPYAAQQEGDMGDAHMMIRAKLMSTFMPKVNGPVWKNGIWMLFTNQLRSKPDKYDPYFAPGGNALPFHASMRFFMRSKVDKDDKATDTEDVSRVTVVCKLQKNKCAPPFREAEYVLNFDTQEVDQVEELAAVFTNPKFLRRLGIVRAGAWYNFSEELMALGFPEKLNGQAKVEEFLRKELEETGDMTFINKVERHVRVKLIPKYDPDHVINLQEYEPLGEAYEGSEE